MSTLYALDKPCVSCRHGYRHRERHTITTAAQLHWSCSSLRLGAWPVKGDPHLGHTIWPSPPAPPLVLRPVPPRHVSCVLPWRRGVVPTGELTLHQTQPEMGQKLWRRFDPGDVHCGITRTLLHNSDSSPVLVEGSKRYTSLVAANNISHH